MGKKDKLPGPKPVNNGPEKPVGRNYVLRLYVIGSTPLSVKAAGNIRKFCDKFLPGRYDLEVINLDHAPELAKEKQLIAAPTLIKELPPPLCRFIGDMSQTNRIIIGLDLDALPPELEEIVD